MICMPGIIFFYKPYHGKGTEGLTEITERETDKEWLLLPDDFTKPFGKIWIKRVFFGMLSGIEEIICFYRRKNSMFIIFKRQTDTIPCRRAKKTIYLKDSLFVCIKFSVQINISQRLKIRINMFESTPCPCITGLNRCFQKR